MKFWKWSWLDGPPSDLGSKSFGDFDQYAVGLNLRFALPTECKLLYRLSLGDAALAESKFCHIPENYSMTFASGGVYISFLNASLFLIKIHGYAFFCVSKPLLINLILLDAFLSSF